jgi:hypothetical protein
VVPKNCCDDDAVEDVAEDDDDGEILNQCKCDFVSNKNLSFHLSPPPPPPPGRTPPPPLPGLGFNGESMSGIKLVTLLETTEQCKTPNLCNKIVGLVLFSLLVDLVLFRRLLAVWSNKEADGDCCCCCCCWRDEWVVGRFIEGALRKGGEGGELACVGGEEGR